MVPAVANQTSAPRPWIWGAPVGETVPIISIPPAPPYSEIRDRRAPRRDPERAPRAEPPQPSIDTPPEAGHIDEYAR